MERRNTQEEESPSPERARFVEVFQNVVIQCPILLLLGEFTG